MAQWANFPWSGQLFTNADETLLRQAVAVVENAYSNQAGGFSRFPGLRSWVSLPGAGRVYLRQWRNHLYAATSSGRLFKVSKNGAVQDVTGVPLSVVTRPVFAFTEDMLVIAAGGPILALAAEKTRLLAGDPPAATHVAWMDGYLIANEPESGRFYFSNAGEYEVWDALNVFTAEAKPDNLTALTVTPFGELLLAGRESIEQWETLADGNRPFYRRFTTGVGLGAQYTLVTDNAGNFGLNEFRQFVQFRAQVTRDQSTAIEMSLESIDDWSEAWAASVRVKGEHFIILQAPNATSRAHGAKGPTFALDIRRQRWATIWGWNASLGTAERWPGWSIEPAWAQNFVGVTDGIAIIERDTHTILGKPMRTLLRPGHVDEFGPSRIDNLRLRVRRGDGGNQGTEPLIGVRMIRDNTKPSNWVWRSMGRAGHGELVLEFGGFGSADTWQMEIACSADVPFEFTRAQIQVERLGW